VSRRPRFIKGIREKLLLSFSLLVASIAVFVFAFFPTRLERQAMHALVDRAEGVRDMTAYSLSAGLFFGDTAAVKEVLAGAARGHDIQFLAVRDATGRPLASRGEGPTEARFASVTPRGYVTDDGATYVTSTSVMHGRMRIGSLVVGVSLADLRRDVATARRLGMLVSLLIFVLGFASVYAISTLVTRPLTAVSHTVKRIAAGDLSLRGVETSDAEVAQLVQAFNHMVDSLAGAQAELSGINQELEVRVDARTAELQNAIAEQRRVQDALGQSEAEARANSEMLQSLIDLAPQSIIGVDLDWKVTRWNKASVDLFGWTPNEVLGNELPYVPDDQREELRLRRSVIEAGRSVVPVEVVRMRKDGTRVSVLLSAGMLRDREQRPAGFIAVVTDLTDRKSLEEQLLQSQKMEAIGRLAGGVAHDFNNMLTVITSSVGMLLEEDERPEDRDDLEAISTAALRASALTRQLLVFSRKQVVHLQSVNISEIVRDTGPMLRRLLRENIQLTTTLAPRLGMVTADPTQLEQVIMNLVVNASDAMPEGGALAIETHDVVVDQAYARHHAGVAPGNYAKLVVRDTGIGMDATTMGKIFEPFFTTKEVGHGTGLGLATTYAVVTRLGGHIHVQSEPGRGTTFEIILPQTMADESQTRSATPSAGSAALVAGQATVLLVEDDDNVRHALRRTLTRQGYTVLQASDGEHGLAVAAGHDGPIDVLVTDLMMPGMNGRVFADKLLQARPSVRVVFMSGYADDTVKREGLVDATHTFLQKPFTGAQLTKTIRDVTSRESGIGNRESQVVGRRSQVAIREQ
jgi:two-component system cell cycle sensor histidine kinase/response regulator CckA